MSRRYRLKASDLAMVAGRAASVAEGKGLDHATLVSHAAFLLAQALETSPQVMRDTTLAGLLHDVGWIPLAAEFARSIGEQNAILREHPWRRSAPPVQLPALLNGHLDDVQSLLSELGLPQTVGDAIVQSHENFDGSGYPDGLEGEEISIEGRVLAVADHLVSALDLDKAQNVPSTVFERLDSVAGSILDPVMVEAAKALWSDPEASAELLDRSAAAVVLDDALFPLCGDFLDVDGGVARRWARFIGHLSDNYIPMVSRYSERVSELSATIAREMRLAPEEVAEIELAANLAEVGRMGLPPTLNFRFGAFTQDERDVLKAYPIVGERILAPVRQVAPIFNAAISHREKYNGSGYPEGLVGEEISLGARIISVATAFVSLTQSTPERPGYEPSSALEILIEQGTKLFDGLVVDALEQVVS
ncbi:MAG: HD domain-containing protein, partial [Myxococcales bacterium]|nr:HD domain-containing protein [Myxococcales bacterium]